MRKHSENPIMAMARAQCTLVLDGGLATTLESHGHDLNDPLWSAKVLIDDPEAIRQVHLEFLRAGADCIIGASYQATVRGFRAYGMSEWEAVELLRLTVTLAVEARDEFWSDPENQLGRQKPLVAASIGPYGAALADGSEYSGHYDISEDELVDFHRPRWQILAETNADLFACETLPSRREVRALLRLLHETRDAWAWMSFSCADETHLSNGSAMVDVARDCDAFERVAAIGVNCTAPRYISSLLAAAREATNKPLIAYPNSGESYSPEKRGWIEGSGEGDWSDRPRKWAERGALVIGGCCRVTPEEISRIHRVLHA